MPLRFGGNLKFTTVLEAIKVTNPVGAPRRRPDRVLADKAYSSRANRGWLRDHRVKATIPTQPTKPATGSVAAARAGVRQRSTRRPTRTVTPSNVASTSSNTKERSLPATTNYKLAVRYTPLCQP